MSQPFPPDMMAAMMGGGAPQPDAGGPMPPDIASLLGGAGGPPPGADAGPTISQGGQPGGGSDLIGQAIDILNEAAKAEADEQDKQVILTCVANLQKVLANNQKDADSMLGGKSTPASMRKAAGGLGYGG